MVENHQQILHSIMYGWLLITFQDRFFYNRFNDNIKVHLKVNKKCMNCRKMMQEENSKWKAENAIR